ncbi:MAG: hypothetical protein JXD21_08080 [Candidatus Omnitrophica bacterium]|nr:hypothetical protein [Candidatus Omnitrophota bacterium]
MNEIVRLIQNGNVVAFCGAGLSCESGIPAFRGEDGLWEKYDPQKYVSQSGIDRLLKEDPVALKEFLLDVLGIIVRAKVNPAHILLSRLEREGYLLGTITQNIDGLHHQAGSINIAELHGNIYRFYCPQCLEEVTLTKTQLQGALLRLQIAKSSREIVHVIKDMMGLCPVCGSRLKSSVILFGQMLPQDEIEKAEQYIENAETLLCIGTSGTVHPAVSFPYYAKENGAQIVTINPQPTVLDEIADLIIAEHVGKCAQTLLDGFLKIPSKPPAG